MQDTVMVSYEGEQIRFPVEGQLDSLLQQISSKFSVNLQNGFKLTYQYEGEPVLIVSDYDLNLALSSVSPLRLSLSRGPSRCSLARLATRRDEMSRKRKEIIFEPLGTSIRFSDLVKVRKDFVVSELEVAAKLDGDGKFFVTELMRDLYSNFSQDDTKRLEFIQGASGVGKTTTLIVLASMARASGCLVFPVQGREFSVSGYQLQWNAMSLLRRWKDATTEAVLADTFSRLEPTESLLDLVNRGLSNPDQICHTICHLTARLLNVEQVPVLITIDQCNAFFEEEPSDDGRKRLCQMFANPERLIVERGAVICAFSCAFRGMRHVKDGNSRLFTELRPMSPSVFVEYIKTVLVGDVPAELQTKDFYDLCGGLPGEASSFLQIRCKQKHMNYEALVKEYFNRRRIYYAGRIKDILGKVARDARETDPTPSISFAARLFVGGDMQNVPSLWCEIGLIVNEGGVYRLPCPAARDGLLSAFDKNIMTLAIEIFSKDASIRWRALELGVVYCVRQHIALGSPVRFEHTDLLGKNPAEITIQIDNVQHSGKQPSANSIHAGTFFVCPTRYPVIDFFLYGRDGTKIMLQVSESTYEDHSSKFSHESTAQIEHVFSLALIPVAAGASQLPALHYYMTTSETVYQYKSKYSKENVRLISNHNKATFKFFEGLITW